MAASAIVPDHIFGKCDISTLMSSGHPHPQQFLIVNQIPKPRCNANRQRTRPNPHPQSNRVVTLDISIDCYVAHSARSSSFVTAILPTWNQDQFASQPSVKGAWWIRHGSHIA
ncbi:hypothetical protein HRR83_000724 [Exophiala dermatitidis]|uniref:Uncharacterized protein n=1 Tax=Exophiala dermatitidis TaxID=5970 RepID=A0AAN6IZ34_EXODE|nr:hypothetical protein HRR74_000728 [Exophiala dermatitidis]KAJ4528606.1 hypothetical protein HRR73_001229 [Exophiala dermatitidis]KAJ4529979.1 hypothetical protein HRR76_009225 [Exophiala dermatitidis]KAJ4558742.1 hypothetical protein HRR77_000726 [Exophiala dermatitidis]KAJ4581230.1 hypothetical protein HRR79_000274 [Exophiala dermatitidis]